YEAPHGSVAPGPISSGAESKRRRCPRSRARQSRVTPLARRRAARPGRRSAAGRDAVEALLLLAPLAELARRPAVLHVVAPERLVARGQELDPRHAVLGQAGALAEGELVASLELEGVPEAGEAARREPASRERLERPQGLLVGRFPEGLVEARPDVVAPGLRLERPFPGAQRVGRVLVAPVLPQELHVVGPHPQQVRVAVDAEQEEGLRVLGVGEAIANERGARQGAGLPARDRRLDGLPGFRVPPLLTVRARDRRLGRDPLQAGLRDAAREPRRGHL